MLDYSAYMQLSMVEIQAYYSENMATQNLWDAAKTVLRGKYIAIQPYLKKQEKTSNRQPTLHLKQLEKEEQKNPPN